MMYDFDLASMTETDAIELGVATPADFATVYDSEDVFNVPANVNNREWVVEKYTYEGKMKAVGKVIPTSETLFLNNDQLEGVWDLANWSVSQPKEVICFGSPYDMSRAFSNEGMVYVPLCEDGVANDDIFIRKHYDCDNGFFVTHSKSENCDKWQYGTRDAFRAYCSLPIYMRR